MSEPSASRPSDRTLDPSRIQVVRTEIKLPAVMQLYPYQQRWIDDNARFKAAVKSARIGFSYATGLEAMINDESGCIVRPNTTWTVLSASKAQSDEFIETCKKNLDLMGATSQLYADEDFIDVLGRIEGIQSRIGFPNGARIIALPANPRTARGYPGNAILDEFGHHQDSYSIWAAIIRQTALGHKVRVLSTPNGEQGMFYDICKDLGLTNGVAPLALPVRVGPWSGHWVDVYIAVREGCPINIDEMRAGVRDPDTFSQEFLCVFLKAAGAWLPIELVAMAEDAGASITWAKDYVPTGPLYSGIDVARDHDKSVLWLDEQIGDVLWTRAVISAHAMPFPRQHELFTPWVGMTTRTAIDSTGMGIALYDYLNESCPGRVMGISFAGTNDQGVKLKTDMAIRIKSRFEKHLDRIPADPQIRQALMAIRRESTASGVRFDAPRIEVDTPTAGGQKRKLTAHADEFWAKALSDLAAYNDIAAAMAGSESTVPAGRGRGAMSRALAEPEPETGELGGPARPIVERRTVWA